MASEDINYALLIACIGSSDSYCTRRQRKCPAEVISRHCPRIDQLRLQIPGCSAACEHICGATAVGATWSTDHNNAAGYRCGRPEIRTRERPWCEQPVLPLP